MTPGIEAALESHLRRLIAAHGASSPLGQDTPLVSSGLLDSLDIVSIVAFAEKEFGARFEPADVTRDSFETPASILALLESRARAPRQERL